MRLKTSMIQSVGIEYVHKFVLVTESTLAMESSVKRIS